MAWIVLLIVVSLQPGRPKAAAGLHREFHVIAFAATAGLIRSRGAGRWPEAEAVVATVLFGAALEFAQSYIYHNPIEWWDVRDNAIGAVVGVLGYHVLSSLWLRVDSKRP